MDVKMCGLLFLVVSAVSLGCAAAENLKQECSGDFQKLMGCLSYASGKGNRPTEECCSSVKSIREREPKCLCYIMQQTHNGSAEIRSLGVQEAKLLQLPYACQLKNVTLSICPKLLGISPNSTDAAIFTNTNASTASVTPSSATTTPTSEKVSGGNNRGPFVAASFVVAVFIHALISIPSHWP